MKKPKIFISHSSKDSIISDALVAFLVSIGIPAQDILCTSTAGTQIPAGQPLYGTLRSVLNNDKTLVIFLLSDNFYASPVCLNEMGATWIKEHPFHYMILPGFSFSLVEGVIKDTTTIGISLAPVSNMTKQNFFDLKQSLESLWKRKFPESRWDIALSRFFNQVEIYAKEAKKWIDTEHPTGWCINELLHNGCQIRRQDTSATQTVAVVNFDLTQTTLCSVVYKTVQTDWVSMFKRGTTLCFDIFSDAPLFWAEVELKLAGDNPSYRISVDNNAYSYRIPLAQFGLLEDRWKYVSEVCFLFRKEYSSSMCTTVTIRNLRLEE